MIARHGRVRWAVLLGGLLAGAAAPVPSPAVRMVAPRPVRAGLAAYPRIAAPATDAQRRINAAVARLDARALAAARDCLTSSAVRRGDWRRTVDVTMRGPQFVSYLVDDDVDCGGAHPDEGHAAIVYDLATGAPVDWARLLPPRLAGALGLTQGEDGVKMVTLASPRLAALYRAGYRRGPGDDPGLAQECAEAIGQDDGTFVQPMLA